MSNSVCIKFKTWCSDRRGGLQTRFNKHTAKVAPAETDSSDPSQQADLNLSLRSFVMSAYVFLVMHEPFDKVRCLQWDLTSAQIITTLADILVADFPFELDPDQSTPRRKLKAGQLESRDLQEETFIKEALIKISDTYMHIFNFKFVYDIYGLILEVITHLNNVVFVPQDYLIGPLKQALSRYRWSNESTTTYMNECLTDLAPLLLMLSKHQVKKLLLEVLSKVTYVIHECLVEKMMTPDESEPGRPDGLGCESPSGTEELDCSVSVEETPAAILSYAVLHISHVRLNHLISQISNMVDGFLFSDGRPAQVTSEPPAEETLRQETDAEESADILCEALLKVAASEQILEGDIFWTLVSDFYETVVRPFNATNFPLKDQVSSYSKQATTRRILQNGLVRLFSFAPDISDKEVLNASRELLVEVCEGNASFPYEEEIEFERSTGNIEEFGDDNPEVPATSPVDRVIELLHEKFLITSDGVDVICRKMLEAKFDDASLEALAGPYQDRFDVDVRAEQRRQRMLLEDIEKDLSNNCSVTNKGNSREGSGAIRQFLLGLKKLCCCFPTFDS